MTPRDLLHPQTLDDMLLYVMWQLQACAGSVVVRLCESEFGITRREWRMLCLLAEAGQLQPSQLAEQAQLDRTRTSRAVTALTAKGLVQRQTQAGDARRALVRLSEAGRALHAELFPRVQAINMQLLGEVAPEDLQAMARAFDAIQRQARRMQQDPELPKAHRNRQPRRDTETD